MRIAFYFLSLFVLLAGIGFSEETYTLDNTQPLIWEDDLSVRLMDGAHRFVERKIEESVRSRGKYWERNFSSAEAYVRSIEPNRNRFKQIIGVVDTHVPVTLEYFGDDENPALVAETDAYRIFQVRWPVLEGLTGEGLLLQPKESPLGYVVAIPDVDQTPEQISGLSKGTELINPYALYLVERGFEVLVPMLINRGLHDNGNPAMVKTQQTHREWIYRQAFHMGRHIIGYEVQKVLAGVDWFRKKASSDSRIGVAGYGEGGLIAFYSAAVDSRIDATLVSGYFSSRQNLGSEPIYRNIWAFLHEFGDAELATLIAPRSLIVEHSPFPKVEENKGSLQTPDIQTVLEEFNRIDTLLQPGLQSKFLIRGENNETIGPGSEDALTQFARLLNNKASLHESKRMPEDKRRSFDPQSRNDRQVLEMENVIQELVRSSDRVRDQFYLYQVMPELANKSWSTQRRHPMHSPQPFIEASKKYRQYFREELMGSFDEPLLPLQVKSRQIYDTERWTGDDVVMDVWPEVFAWGVLLVPKDLQPGERRPVVVCQHGRQGLPKDTIEGETAYNQFAARLADQGFITFSPHNLYRGEDRYRWLDRKANGVKATLFSFIISQHEQILRWLNTLPFVDGKRIAFYGLSYGGETAMRVPPILEGYCLSICSGDFNQWTRKVAATDQEFSFMNTIEWEMPYFNLGQTFDYAEMAYLMIPRPFMVERGHHDLVGRDPWVAYEYAKVRWLYTQLGLENLTEIEYFNGGHAINAEGSFEFLHRHLNWPVEAKN